MSSAFPISPFDTESENWWSKGTSRLAERVYNVGLFVRGLRVRMRFGDLTRAPLRMVRLQLKENVAECDWIARMPDPWDEGLRPDIGQRHASLQALKDAVDVRFFLFEMLPDVDAAYLRIYRETPVRARELIIAGHVHRKAGSNRSVHSIAMRAKLLGFRFSLEGDILCPTREMTNLELVDW
jgi:hypothetical protein